MNRENTIAVLALALIAIASMLAIPDASKEIALTISSGIVGWLARSRGTDEDR